ncbi:hypothetical protein K2Z84_05620 [Candidatus Binatia bacterium]|nr:hypothetical protein [Candidatus Binatia bacterium]
MVGCLLVVATTGAACTRPLLERAIAARGGPLESLSRESTADVYRGFPGTWAWRFDYLVPDRLRWTIETYGEEQSVAYDGTRVRYFLGSGALPDVPAALSDFASIVRWTSVTTLDALASDPRATVRELSAAERPPDAAAALEVRYDDGARYVLAFDARDRLVAAEGPIVVPTVAAGRMHATYADFADTEGYDLPATCSYSIDGQPFFREQVRRWWPNDPRLGTSSFAGPPVKRR